MTTISRNGRREQHWLTCDFHTFWDTHWSLFLFKFVLRQQIRPKLSSVAQPWGPECRRSKKKEKKPHASTGRSLVTEVIGRKGRDQHLSPCLLNWWLHHLCHLLTQYYKSLKRECAETQTMWKFVLYPKLCENRTAVTLALQPIFCQGRPSKNTDRARLCQSEAKKEWSRAQVYLKFLKPLSRFWTLWNSIYSQYSVSWPMLSKQHPVSWGNPGTQYW